MEQNLGLECSSAVSSHQNWWPYSTAQHPFNPAAHLQLLAEVLGLLRRRNSVMIVSKVRLAHGTVERAIQNDNTIKVCIGIGNVDISVFLRL